jgi:hypothetical protein
LWHLLSLDAPTVAALWTWFVARTSHVSLPLASPLATALAAWVLYATDRLLDARQLDGCEVGPRDKLEARHLFHHRHRRLFLRGIAVAAIGVVVLLPRLDPAAIRLYMVEGALLLGWFLVLHATHRAHRLPKEIAVGLFFSAATFIPTVARAPGLRLALLPGAILFASLGSLNCLFICRWEHGDPGLAPRGGRLTSARPVHATTQIALAHLGPLAFGVATLGAALAIVSPAHLNECPISVACALSAVLLLLLDHNRQRLSQLDLRAAADLALLTPLLLLPFPR